VFTGSIVENIYTCAILAVEHRNWGGETRCNTMFAGCAASACMLFSACPVDLLNSFLPSCEHVSHVLAATYRFWFNWTWNCLLAMRVLQESANEEGERKQSNRQGIS
jgi:hypothetical protein